MISVFALFFATLFGGSAAPALTLAANGPYHVRGNLLLDKNDRPYLIRGTSLAVLSDSDPAAFSAMTLVTIRQRVNMNAVRVIVDPDEYNRSPQYQGQVERLIGLANEFGLLAVLDADRTYRAGDADTILFWKNAASQFRHHPNLLFAPMSADLIAVIRGSGALQPLIVSIREENLTKDPNAIYQVSPSYGELDNEADRKNTLADAARVPLLVEGLDPRLDEPSGECGHFPSDPSRATELIEANLKYFDAESISWTLSSFTPGKLITDYRYFNHTTLESGWVCGEKSGSAGIGLTVLSHLWNATPMGLFAVSESRGGMALARGGLSTAYGPILADEDLSAHGPVLPTHLGNVSVRITDARGVARLAPLLHTGAGWAFISYVVPDECATGPAEVAIVRDDGSVSTSRILIADIAPAMLSIPPDGRSIAAAQVTQQAIGGKARKFRAWQCDSTGCRAVPIDLKAGTSTTLRIPGTGFRHAGEHPDVKVTIGGLPAQMLSIGRDVAPGSDQITIRVPDALANTGETDLWFRVNGEVSNVVRVNFGSANDPIHARTTKPK